MRPKGVKSAFIAIALLGALPGQTGVIRIGPDVSIRHASGIEIVGRGRQAAASEPLAKAFSDALHLASAYPDDLGYPYPDARTSTLVLRSATPTGDRLLATWTTSGLRATIGLKDEFLAPPAVAHRIVTTRRPASAIDQVRDLGSAANRSLRNAGLLVASQPDFERNRVTFAVARVDDGLMFDLAARYGAANVAVRLDDVGPIWLNRKNDGSPFKAGAQLIAPAGPCTSGFPWVNQGSANYMITAGNCAPNGGNVIILGAP